jgi:hypothetical protein
MTGRLLTSQLINNLNEVLEPKDTQTKRIPMNPLSNLRITAWQTNKLESLHLSTHSSEDLVCRIQRLLLTVSL